MKIFSKLLYLSSVVLFIASCNDNRMAQSDFVYQANIGDVKDTVLFQDIVENYRMIPLQTGRACRIGEVSDLIVTDTLFYVVSDGVYCFSKSGEFRYAINKKGHARDEYVAIASVNVSGGNIYLYDAMQGKILVFDCVDGTCRNSITMPYTVARVFCNENLILADRSDLSCTVVPNNERYFVCSAMQMEDVSNAYLDAPECRIPVHGQSTCHADGFFFSNFWRCQTWKIGCDECQPYLQLAFPSGLALAESDIEPLIASRQLSSESLTNAGKAWGLGNVHENDDIISGDFCVGSSPASFIYAKATGKSVAYKFVAGEGPWQPAPINLISAYRKSAYKVIPSEDIVMVRTIRGITSLPKQEANPSNPHDVYCSVEETDNPVIVEYVFK